MIRALGHLSFALAFFALPLSASADQVPLTSEAPPPPVTPSSGPKVGGHFGTAIPLISIDHNGFSNVGSDFWAFGITPGITVKLDERWMIDFEFIGLSRWEKVKDGPDISRTVWVVDPGVLYNFGPVVAGVRAAMVIGGPMNLGVVPIVVVPFTVSDKLKYFVEMDAPMFINGHTDKARGSVGLLFQTGFAF